jgi:hypothetical protein
MNQNERRSNAGRRSGKDRRSGSDPAARLAYQELAQGWRHLADHLDWLARGRKREPPSSHALNPRSVPGVS